VSDVSAVESAAIRSSCSPKLRDAYGSVNAFWSFLTRNIQKVGMAATDSPQRNKAAEAVFPLMAAHLEATRRAPA
jgi:hypothetical protein